MNRTARFKTIDLRRALRAAAQVGPDYVVEVAPDGTIRIVRTPTRAETNPALVDDEVLVF